MRVLKIKSECGKFFFIQKITDKTICVVMDEDNIAHFSTETGKFRGPRTAKFSDTLKSVVLPLSPIKNYFRNSRSIEWNGGWSTKHNSKMEIKVPDMPKFKKFKGYENPMEDWFGFQGVEITTLNN